MAGRGGGYFTNKWAWSPQHVGGIRHPNSIGNGGDLMQRYGRNSVSFTTRAAVEVRPHSGKEFVMQNGGFFEKRRTNTTGLGIVIAGHAILLTAIALNPTRYGPHIDFIPTLENYPADDPPPPYDPPKPP